MKLKRILSLVLFLLLTTALTAFAEEKEKAIKLEDIVVTATRTEKDAAEAPGSISVVTKEDIEKRNVQTIVEAVNALPGVYTARGSVTDFSPQITLRGIPGNRSLVLMDGITLNHPQFGGLLGAGAYAPEVVERIEVVKGPFSSLYGGHAMGGVVNIITKMPEKREFTVKSGYGSSWNRGEAADDLRKFYVSYGDKFKDKLSIFLSYGRKETNGFPTVYNVQSTQPPAGISGWSNTTDPMGNPRYLIGDKGDTRWWDDNITLKTEFDFSDTSKINLSFFRKRFKQHYDDPHTYLKDAAGNPVYSYGAVPEASFFSWQDFRQEVNTYNISYETEISTVKSKLSFCYVDSIEEGHKFPAGGSTRSGGPGVFWDHPINDHYKTELQFTAPLFKRQLLTFGGSFEHNSGESVEYGLTNWMDEDSKSGIISQKKGEDRIYAFFVQDEIMILDNLTAYIGFRQDWWETYDGYVYEAGIPITYDSNAESSFSPKVALVYKPFGQTTLRASAGTAFRPPTVYQLYSRWISPTGIAYAGSPDLKPETTKSWDIGAEQALWKGAKIKATYYENYMEDFIYSGMTTSTLYENKNVGKAESKGIELEAEQKVNKWLKLFANFTYTDSEITENPAKPTTVGKRLTMLPDKMFNIGADLTKGPFSASLIGRYVSKIYINDDNSDIVDNVQGSCDPYFTADAKVSYDITKFARLSFSVDNIFDEDYFYSTSGNGKTPCRSWFGELMLRY